MRWGDDLAGQTKSGPFEGLRPEARLAKLSRVGRAAFACASAELAFILDSKARQFLESPGSDVIRDALDGAWQFVTDGTTDTSYPHEALLPLIPDDDDPGWSVARAILGCTSAAAAYAVWVVEEDSVVNAKWAAGQIYDVAEFYSRNEFQQLDNAGVDALPPMTWVLDWIDGALRDAGSMSPLDLKSMAEAKAIEFSAFFDVTVN